VIYLFGRALFSLYIKVFFRFKVLGKENIPPRKPFIICANHVRMIDPMVVGAAFPPGYKVHFMAKQELFRNSLLSFLLRKAGAFPVDRHEKGYGAIRSSLSLLQSGKIIGLFPEGSRSRDGLLQKAHDGASLIAVRSGYPIIPVAINSTYRLFKKLEVHIGPAFVLPALEYETRDEKKEALEKMSCQIMANIRKLLP